MWKSSASPSFVVLSPWNFPRYNPDHTPCTQQQTEVGNDEAGPSSAGNMHMPDELEEALSSFGDEEDETLRMGPA